MAGCGPENIFKSFRDRAREHEIVYIQPAKPAINPDIERFNRSYRQEILDIYLFESIEHAQMFDIDRVFECFACLSISQYIGVMVEFFYDLVGGIMEWVHVFGVQSFCSVLFEVKDPIAGFVYWCLGDGCVLMHVGEEREGGFS